MSGQLKVAPEHVSDAVLSVMGKPGNAVYERFRDRYARVNADLGKKQYLVPYLMSSHPGSTLKEAVELAEYCRDLGYMPEQVQDFYPTPSTMSTCMYYTGVDPRTMKPVYTPKSTHEKALQRALIQYRDPKNHDLVIEALRKAGRMDLVGYGPDARYVRAKEAGRTGAPRAKGAGRARALPPTARRILPRRGKRPAAVRENGNNLVIVRRYRGVSATIFCRAQRFAMMALRVECSCHAACCRASNVTIGYGALCTTKGRS
ncbi:MAG: DUF3362 domain-containing protein [Slackia sp.]